MGYIRNRSKVLTRKKIRTEVERLKKSGKKVVFTNGCFDLLHVGHVELLTRAKKLGDVLIVAINSDESLRYLKGQERPLVGERDRAKLLLSLKCVDYVVVFDEQTPEKVLSELLPDVLVKGGDYEPSEIVGREYVKKVCTVPIIKGRSTTNLIKLIVNRYGYKKI